MAHALVVGGTGMLAEVVGTLAKTYTTVSVIGRSSARLNSLQKYSDGIYPLQVDYTRDESLRAAIADTCEKNAPITFVVCWVHDTAPEVPFAIAQQLSSYSVQVRFFHLLSSAYSDPARGADQLRKRFARLPQVSYHQVLLGFVISETSSRWLTNQEIAQGTLKAIEQQQEQSVVGVVTPWDRAP